MVAEFRAIATQIQYQSPQIPVVSNLTGTVAPASQLSQADYWCEQLRQPVQFAAGIQTLLELGCGEMVEIGPHPVLLGLGRQGWAEPDVLWLPSLRRGQSDWDVLLNSLSSLYVRGKAVNWQSFDRDYPRRRVSLPTYPFQRQRYWFNAAQPINQSAVEEPQQDCLYTLQWQIQEIQEIQAAAARPGLYESLSPSEQPVASHADSSSQQWLILGDRTQQLGERLARTLTARGAFCQVVYTCASDSRVLSHDCKVTERVDSDSPEAFSALLRSSDWTGIVYLWGLDEAAESCITDVSVLRHPTACAGLLHLTQAIVRTPIPSPGRLWVVTQAAQRVEPADSPVSVLQTLLWGLGRVIALEHPERWGGLIDVPESLEDRVVAAIATEISQINPADQIAIRNNQRHVPRLIPWQPPQSVPGTGVMTPEAAPLRIGSDGTYLITGALGGLGLQLTQWLVQQGARYLALISRRTASPGAAAILEQLQAQGVHIDCIQADVAEAEQVAQALARLQPDPPLKGVFHLAGVLDDGVLLHQNWGRFETVLQPKVAGAWNLHLHTQALSLDWFVLFSSAASLLGSPGQGNYAAANAFLDGLAHLRRSQGLPALSINWSPWGQAGMAAALDDRTQQRWQRAGVQPLMPEQGWAILRQLGTQAPAQIGVLPIDWARFQAQLPNPQRYPMLQGLWSPTLTPEATAAGQKGWEALSLAQRRTYILEVLQQQVAGVVGRELGQALDPHTGFFELGMDSLMALEFRTRLQTHFDVLLPSTISFDCPTIATLTDYLLAQLSPPMPTPTELTSEPADAAGTGQLLQSLSETELLELIDQEYATWVTGANR
jgi:acyl transferase domain-containing protein/acyl carrier protein